MSDTRHEVEVRFTAKDMTSAVINKINKSAGVLSKRVDAITTKVADFSKTYVSLGVAFGFGASIVGAKRYLATIEQLSTMTGMTANKTAGMQHAMEQSGLSAEETRTIMVSIARKQADIVGGSIETAKMAKRYGIELKKGPEAALVSMAKQVKAGKIGVGEVVKLLEESGAKAMDLLKKGGPEVQRLLSEGAKKNSHINATSIVQYKEMDIQMTRVKQAWTRITTTVMIKLAPALTKLMKNIEDNIDGWIGGAKRFGGFLVEHMDAAITSAKVFGKIMLTNYALMKLTGEGMLGNVGKMLKFAKGKKAAPGEVAAGGDTAGILTSLLGGRKGKGGALDISGRKGVMAKRAKDAAASVLPFKHIRQHAKSFRLSLALVFTKVGKISGRVGKVFLMVGKVFSKIAVGAASLGRIAMVLLKLSVIGAAVTAAVSGIKQIISNVDGIRDRMGALLGSTWENIKSIGEAIAPLFGPGSVLRNFFDILGGAFKTTIEFILFLLEKMTHAAAVTAVMATEVVGPAEAERRIASRRAAKVRSELLDQEIRARKIHSALIRIRHRELDITAKTVGGYNDMILAYKKSGAFWAQSAKGIAAWTKKMGFEAFAKVAVPTTPKERAGNNFDFRGSRFDIQQNFAEGFDPDRIAVAFANDLSSLGERRLSSGIAGAFAAP